MGHHYHTRVVINGETMYNLGGDTSLFLRSQIKEHHEWHPLIENRTSYPWVIGTGRFDVNEISIIMLIHITRTQGRSRRIDGFSKYWYDNGGFINALHFTMGCPCMYDRRIGKWIPAFLNPESIEYREYLNHVQVQSILKNHIHPFESRLPYAEFIPEEIKGSTLG